MDVGRQGLFSDPLERRCEDDEGGDEVAVVCEGDAIAVCDGASVLAVLVVVQSNFSADHSTLKDDASPARQAQHAQHEGDEKKKQQKSKKRKRK